MLTLETEIGNLTRRLADYEKTLSQFQKERRHLASAKNALNEKYNILRKNALQLDTFRKQIVSMVEFSPHAITIPDNEASFVDISTAIADFDLDPQQPQDRPSLFDADLNSFTTDTFVRQAALHADAKGGEDAAMETLHLTPFQGDETPKRSPRRFKSPAVGGKVKQEAPQHPGDVSVDAPTLYKQIREVLTPEEFDQFATCIANFNAGNLSARETVQSIHRLIKVTSLVQQMKALIHRAMAESSQESSSVLQQEGSLTLS